MGAPCALPQLLIEPPTSVENTDRGRLRDLCRTAGHGSWSRLGMATLPSRNSLLPVPTAVAQSLTPPDVIALSHLRWDFVFQRPQHLLTRCARRHRVFVIEEPIAGEGPARFEVSVRQHGIRVVVPRLPEGLTVDAADALQSSLLHTFFREHSIGDYLLWYYPPMALAFPPPPRPP